MPTTSSIQLLRDLSLFVGCESVISKDSLLKSDDIILLITILEISRKAEDSIAVPKSMEWYYNILSTEKFDGHRFRCQLRMERAAFDYLLQLLKGE